MADRVAAAHPGLRVVSHADLVESNGGTHGSNSIAGRKTSPSNRKSSSPATGRVGASKSSSSSSSSSSTTNSGRGGGGSSGGASNPGRGRPHAIQSPPRAGARANRAAHSPSHAHNFDPDSLNALQTAFDLFDLD